MTPLGVGSFFGTYLDTANPPVIKMIVAGAAIAARSIQAVKVDWKKETVFQPLHNGNGVPVGYNKVRIVKTVSLECVVRVTTLTAGSLAARKAAILPPDDFSLVTLEDFVGNDDTFMNGDYVHETGASLSFSDEGEAVLKMDLKQFFTSDGTAITPASLTATLTA